MKTLFLTLAILAMAVPAMALECPQNSKKELYNTPDGHSFEFSCNDGYTYRAIKMVSGSSPIVMFELTTGMECIESTDMVVCVKPLQK